MSDLRVSRPRLTSFLHSAEIVILIFCKVEKMLPLDDVLPELAWPVSAPHCDIVRNVNTNY